MPFTNLFSRNSFCEKRARPPISFAKCDKDATGAGRMKPPGDHFLTLDLSKCFIALPYWRILRASSSGFQFPPVGQASVRTSL